MMYALALLGNAGVGCLLLGRVTGDSLAGARLAGTGVGRQVSPLLSGVKRAGFAGRTITPREALAGDSTTGWIGAVGGATA